MEQITLAQNSVEFACLHDCKPLWGKSITITVIFGWFLKGLFFHHVADNICSHPALVL